MGTHGMGDLDPHVTQSAQTDDADLLPGAGAPVAQGRVGRDAGTEQGSDAGQIFLVMPDAQDKGLLDHDRLRIAAVGVLAAKERAVVGAGEAVVAILLLAVVTGRAMAATIDQAADPGEVADLELRHLVADGDHTADDLVTGNRRIEGVLPFVAGGVQVGMAHAAEQDLDPDVFRPGIATLDFVGSERAVFIYSSIGFGLDHDFSSIVGSRLRGIAWAGGVERVPLGRAHCKKDLCSTP